MKENPFVGPTPFEFTQSDIFFGRSNDIKSLTSMVIAQRLVLLYSASGTGKTSLIQAGVLPALEAKGCRVLNSVRLGAQPDVAPALDENVFMKNLLSQLKTNGLDRESNAQSLEKFLVNQIVTKVDDPSSRRVPVVVLVLDQFEEIFTSHTSRWRDRKPFMQELANTLGCCDPPSYGNDKSRNALYDKIALRVIISIREEYIAYLEQFYDILPELRVCRYRLGPLTKTEALEAITKPAEKAGRPIAKRFAEQIVEQLVQIPVRSGADVTSLSNPLRSRNYLPSVITSLVGQKNVESGNRDQSWIVEYEAVEPVQLQVVCADIWRSTNDSTIDEASLPRDWTVEAGLGRFYEDALAYAVNQFDGRQEPSVMATLKNAALAQVRFLFHMLYWAGMAKSYVPQARLRRWLSQELITPMGTRAPVLYDPQSRVIPTAVVDRLKKRYLLRAEPRFGVEWLELAHDRLVGPIIRSNGRWFASQRAKLLALNSTTALCLMTAIWFQQSSDDAVDSKTRAKVFKGLLATNPDIALLLTAHSAEVVRENQRLRGKRSTTFRSRPFISESQLADFLSDPHVRQAELRAIVRLPALTNDIVPLDSSFAASYGGTFPVVWRANKQVANSADQSSAFEKKCSGSGFSQIDKGFALKQTDMGFDVCNDFGVIKVRLDNAVSQSLTRSVTIADDNESVIMVECSAKDGSCSVARYSFGSDHAFHVTKRARIAEYSGYRRVEMTSAGPSNLSIIFCEGRIKEACRYVVYNYSLPSFDAADAEKGLISSGVDLGADAVGSIAVSEQNVAISLKANGESSRGRIRVIPIPLREKTMPWIPDGSRQIAVPTGLASRVVFDKTGRYLAAVSNRGFLTVYDLVGGPFGSRVQFQEDFGGNSLVNSIAVFDDGKAIAVAGGGLPGSQNNDRSSSVTQCLSIWRFGSGNWRRESFFGPCDKAWPSFGNTKAWSSVVASRDGSIVAAGGMTFSEAVLSPLLLRSQGEGRTTAFDKPYGETISASRVGGIAVSSSGHRFVLGKGDGEILLLEQDFSQSPPGQKTTTVYTQNTDCVQNRSPNSSGKISALAFNPNDEDELSVVDIDGCIQRFHIKSDGDRGRRWERTWAQDMAAFLPSNLVYSPDGRWLAVAVQDGRVFVWDRNHDSRPPAIIVTRVQWIGALAWVQSRNTDDARNRPLLVLNGRAGPIGAWTVVSEEPEFIGAPVRAEVLLAPLWLDPFGISATAAFGDRVYFVNTKGQVRIIEGVVGGETFTERLVQSVCSIAEQAVQLSQAGWDNALAEAWESSGVASETGAGSAVTRRSEPNLEGVRGLYRLSMQWAKECLQR